ncbi:MAG: hypothetical protein ABSC94_31670 [Polyangiaceae bacterium]|jgi:hypothetical protein
MRVWVTNTVLGATARKTEMVFRSSSVRASELREEGGDVAKDGNRGSALDVGDGGGDRHATTAENPSSAEKMSLLERTLRLGIAPSVGMALIPCPGSWPRDAKENHCGIASQEAVMQFSQSVPPPFYSRMRRQNGWTPRTTQ